MALVIFRELTRSQYPLQRAIAIQRFYSTKPSTTDNASNKASQPNKSEDDLKKTPKSLTRIDELKVKLSESQYSSENVRKNISGYVFSRFIDYVKNYDKLVEKKYPQAMKVYRVFMDGVKYFYRDMKDYTKITTSLFGRSENINKLPRRELEVLYQMPRDMRKVGPLLVVSTIPFAQYLTMPIAYMYPRKLLTYHFWTLQQRSEFAVINLSDRLSYNRKVFRSLQAKLPQIKNDKNYVKWKHILGLIGSGLHPSAEEIISVKELFAEVPYKTKSLSYAHIKSLCGLHGLNRFFFTTSNLAHRAKMLNLMDKAIVREGGTQNLATETLRDCCFIRGLNASNMSNDDLIVWLDKWIEVSKCIDKNNFSLFLHLPILLTYNHPNNWKLVYHDNR